MSKDKSVFLCAGVFVMLFLSGQASAQDPCSIDANTVDLKTETFKFETSGDQGNVGYRLIFSTLLVTVLGIGAIYASKKFIPRINSVSGKQIRIVEHANLGNRRMLHLIEIAGKKILVGSTPESMTKLCEYEAEKKYEDIAQQFGDEIK